MNLKQVIHFLAVKYFHFIGSSLCTAPTPYMVVFKQVEQKNPSHKQICNKYNNREVIKNKARLLKRALLYGWVSKYVK